MSMRRETVAACLRLGEKLIAPKLADCSPMQGFYRRDGFTKELKMERGGRQFLRLAVALVASLEVERAAAVLAKVLEDEDNSQSYVTWSYHLKKLLAKDARARAQFGQLVVKWQAYSVQCGYYGPGHDSDVLKDTCPDVDSLVLLIKEMRNGVGKRGKFVVFAASGWPWAMALLELLFGPPLSARSRKLRQFGCGISIALEKRTEKLEKLRIDNFAGEPLPKR